MAMSLLRNFVKLGMGLVAFKRFKPPPLYKLSRNMCIVWIVVAVTTAIFVQHKITITTLITFLPTASWIAFTIFTYRQTFGLAGVLYEYNYVGLIAGMVFSVSLSAASCVLVITDMFGGIQPTGRLWILAIYFCAAAATVASIVIFILDCVQEARVLAFIRRGPPKL